MAKIITPLTDTAIRKAKAADKPLKLRDGRGLYILINRDGSKWWRWDYRRPKTSSRNTLSLGTYPEITLAEARNRMSEAAKLLASGIDPGVERKAAKVAVVTTSRNCFSSVSSEWLSKQPWVPRYRVKVEGWLKNDVLPYLGERDIGTITAPEFLTVLQRVEAREAYESAHRIMQICGQIMRFAIATGRADRNPVADLRGALTPAPDRHHAAITDPREFGGLLRAIDTYSGNHSTRAAFRLAPLLFVRPGELRNAEWSEIDLEKAEWNIPASKMKMKVAHLVPLCRQAQEILADLHAVTSKGRYVFPSNRGPDRPISDNALTSALRRIGYDKGTVTIHGFRATSRTLLDEVLGFRPDIIEHQLAHAVRDPNGRAYNRTSHLQARADMMQVWADYLDALRMDSGDTFVERFRCQTIKPLPRQE